ncbi:MAG: hypothetical protein IJ574_05945 [Bacilli bacterium]|nr:hypothetical protein [Bacilli bacterium]
MKKTIIPILCLFVIAFVIFNLDPISNKVADLIENDPKVIIASSNEYKRDYEYKYVKQSVDYKPLSKQDLVNIIYSTINNGWETFTFYCPSEYTNCTKDMEELSGNNILLTHINNFVSPFNSFTNIQTTISDSGEISLSVKYLYTKEQIEIINAEISKIISEKITDNMDTIDKIKVIHDYIINNSDYDIKRNNTGESTYLSYIAYGPLIDGYATCNGYTDVMALFLDRFGIQNFKVGSTPEEIGEGKTGHVWNAVYINNEWRHLDLTWDDPVMSDGSHQLFHNYFLITTEEMALADKSDNKDAEVIEHKFNHSVYQEFNAN